ncbi:MAG TPA: XopAW family type III secretion system calcium-binding effector [Rhodoferax sp.]|nr:XopAW family type III secretion system calcium-binding effector [Rhodoferax sp.]
MSTISGVSSASSAWATMSAMRANRPPGGMSPDKMFAKVDADSSGGVDKAELQGILDDITQKTGVANNGSGEDLFGKMDSNGDGSLSKDELGEGMKSIMPPPPSTMDFAQTRGEGSDSTDGLFGKIDIDADGSVSKDELQSLLDKMKAGRGADETSTSGADDLFGKLDSDGDGSLSQTEFEAGRPKDAGGPQGAGGMPPTPPGGAAGGASSASTTFDPLDTNQDGTVSAQERLAGATASSTDAVQALFKAIDTDGDSKISSGESEAFIKQLTSQIEAKGTESQSKADSVNLAELVRQVYEQVAGGRSLDARGATLSTTA